MCVLGGFLFARCGCVSAHYPGSFLDHYHVHESGQWGTVGKYRPLDLLRFAQGLRNRGCRTKKEVCKVSPYKRHG